jgi:hypothetical protein
MIYKKENVTVKVMLLMPVAYVKTITALMVFNLNIPMEVVIVMVM